MSRVDIKQCQIIVYPCYSNWVDGKGTVIPASVIKHHLAPSLDKLIIAAERLVKLNDYYGCAIIYQNKRIYDTHYPNNITRAYNKLS